MLLRNPLKKRKITSAYGPRNLAISDNFHDGEDQEAKFVECHSPGDNGIVMKARKQDLDVWGLYVDIYYQELGITVRLAHLSKVLVNENDSVDMDTIIGITGNSGVSTGPHLHVGIYNSGFDDMMDKDPENGSKHKNSIDPAIYFDRIPEDILELNVTNQNVMIRAVNDGLYKYSDTLRPLEPVTRLELAIVDQRRRE